MDYKKQARIRAINKAHQEKLEIEDWSENKQCQDILEIVDYKRKDKPKIEDIPF